MLNIMNGDIYRAKKSKLLYGVLAFSAFIALFLMILNRNDIRLGVSIFGNLTAFISAEDVLKLGSQYQKGLGIVVAIFVATFIGQEYQWNTWQHKWLIGKHRTWMYFSKLVISSMVSIIVFLIFELIALLCSGQIIELFKNGYMIMLLCGSLIYAALGAVLCLISMLIKGNIASIVATLGYIFVGETLSTVLRSISSSSVTLAKIVTWGIQHSIYGMSSTLSTAPLTVTSVFPIAISALGIWIITTIIGMMFFRRYEL